MMFAATIIVLLQFWMPTRGQLWGNGWRGVTLKFSQNFLFPLNSIFAVGNSILQDFFSFSHVTDVAQSALAMQSMAGRTCLATLRYTHLEVTVRRLYGV